jgi:small subunit ribosomal protein S21
MLFLFYGVIKKYEKIIVKPKNFYIFVIYLYFMIIINLSKEKNIESALRTYKQKVQKTKQIQKLRERQEFVKPSVKRRKEVLKAVYVQQIKNGLN